MFIKVQMIGNEIVIKVICLLFSVLCYCHNFSFFFDSAELSLHIIFSQNTVKELFPQIIQRYTSSSLVLLSLACLIYFLPTLVR